MKNSIDILNAVKSKTGAVSDYALAKILSTSHQAIYNYMTKNRGLSDEIAVKAASILEIDPAITLALVHAEGARTENERTAWMSILERLGGVAAALVVSVGLTTTPAPAQANSGATSYNNQQCNVYYVKLHNYPCH